MVKSNFYEYNKDFNLVLPIHLCFLNAFINLYIYKYILHYTQYMVLYMPIFISFIAFPFPFPAVTLFPFIF